MLKKIFAFLLVPAMAIGMFIGCGKKHTLLDVQKYYNNMVEKYSEAVVGDLNKEKMSYVFAQRTSDGKVPGTLMYITYKGALGKGLNDISSGTNNVSDKNLYNRYYALVYVEQKLLDWIYRYYTNWSEKLYASYDLIKHDIKQNDVENLYKKLEKLDEQIGKFITEKTKAEDEINAISFEGAINLTSFTYAFNDLIETSFDFVNAFKDFHVKYVWNTYTFGKDKDTNLLLLNRLIDEAYLNMAQVVYLENVKAFEYSECDLNELIKLTSGLNQQYVIAGLLFKTGTNPCFDINKSVYKSDNTYFSADDVVLKQTGTTEAGEKIYEDYNTKLEKFVYYLKAFNQKVNIYKNVYSKLDFYKYNQIRLGFGTMDLKTYKESLGRVDKANVSLVENFATQTFTYFVNSFVGIFD